MHQWLLMPHASSEEAASPFCRPRAKRKERCRHCRGTASGSLLPALSTCMALRPPSGPFSSRRTIDLQDPLRERSTWAGKGTVHTHTPYPTLPEYASNSRVRDFEPCYYNTPTTLALSLIIRDFSPSLPSAFPFFTRLLAQPILFFPFAVAGVHANSHLGTTRLRHLNSPWFLFTIRLPARCYFFPKRSTALTSLSPGHRLPC
jgi:hypothetical protein